MGLGLLYSTVAASVVAPRSFLTLVRLAGEDHLPMEPWVALASSELLYVRWGSSSILSLQFFCCERSLFEPVLGSGVEFMPAAFFALKTKPPALGAPVSFYSLISSWSYVVKQAHLGEVDSKLFTVVAVSLLIICLPAMSPSIMLSRSICLSTRSMTDWMT